ANRLVNVGIVVILLKFGIVERQRRNRRSQNIHRKSMLGGHAQQVEDGCIQLAFLSQPLAKFAQLVALRQSSEPQQVAGFLKIGVVGEVVDIDAAIGQDALFTIDVANAGNGSYDAFKSFGGMAGG